METLSKVQHKYGLSNIFFLDDLYLDFNRHLERARIVFAIENEMTTEERNLPTNKYWTNVDGERYLQVEEVDDEIFRGGDDDDNDNKEDDHASNTSEH
jgi:hypothetical protein